MVRLKKSGDSLYVEVSGWDRLLNKIGVRKRFRRRFREGFMDAFLSGELPREEFPAGEVVSVEVPGGETDFIRYVGEGFGAFYTELKNLDRKYSGDPEGVKASIQEMRGIAESLILSTGPLGPLGDGPYQPEITRSSAESLLARSYQEELLFKQRDRISDLVENLAGLRVYEMV